MQRTQSSLVPGLARALAILAGVAGVLAGGLRATFGAGLACLSTCPSQAEYVAQFASGTMHLMVPSFLLGLLSLLVYLGYCLAMGQPRAMFVPLLASAVACVALVIFARSGLAHLPATSDGLLAAVPLENWEGEWGIALMLAAGGWSALMTQQARVLPMGERDFSAAQ